MRVRGDLAEMINLGPKSAGRSVAVGIKDAEALHQVGAAAAYHRVKARFPDKTSLNLLWAIQGALMELHWLDGPDEIKQLLRDELTSLPDCRLSYDE